MVDVARLGLEADTSGLLKGEAALSSIVKKAKETEVGVKSAMGGAGDAMAGAGAKATEAGRRVKTAGDQIKGAGDKAKTAGDQFKGAGDGADALGKRASGSSNGMRMMAQQLSQVGQQGAATGNYIQALSIQIPDMLLGFGMWGAVIGTAAAVMGPFIASMVEASGAGRSLEDAMGGVGDAFKAYSSFAEIAATDTAELHERFGEFAGSVRGFAGYIANVKLGQTFDELGAAIDPVKGKLGDVQSLSLRLQNAVADASARAAAMGIDPAQAVQQSDRVRIALNDLNDAAADLGLSAEDALKLGAAIDGLGAASAAKDMAAVAKASGDAFAIIRGMYPEGQKLPEPLRESASALEEMHRMASETANSIKDATSAAGQFKLMSKSAADVWGGMSNAGGFGSHGVFGTGMDAAKGIIRDKEGFSSQPYWDVNHWRAGYGSDTGTAASGAVYSVQKGSSVSLDDAERDLERRIADYFQTIIATIGPDAFRKLNEQQQGVLASLVHNYGAGEFRAGGDLGGVVAGVKSGNSQATANEIARLGSQNGGVNMARRMDEARMFGGASSGVVGQIEAQNKATQEQAQLAKQAQAARDAFTASLKESMTQQEFEASIVGKSADEQERLMAAWKLAQKAKEAGVDLNARLAGSELTYKQAIDQVTAARAKEAVATNEQKSAQQGFIDALTGGSDALSSVLDNLGKKLLEMAFFGSSGTGGLLGGLLGGGSAAGSIFGAIFGREGGGTVAQGQPYVVGEKRPELFIPEQAGTIVPYVPEGGGSAQSVAVGVSVDNNGNLQAYVKKVADTAARAAGVASQRNVMASLRASKSFARA